MLHLWIQPKWNVHTGRKDKGRDGTTGRQDSASLAGNRRSIIIPTKGRPGPKPRNLNSALTEDKMDKALWQMAYDSDFRKACEILGYDSEDPTEDERLEIAVFLMTAEEL
jgi:hypothetical protein